jgi:uncharacterized protein YebE (UPF0316 family)
MNWALLFTCLLIAVARVTDMTLDTIRTVAIVQGRRIFASLLGFVEALVYIVAVAKVLANFDHFIYAIAYSAGFAAGTFLGITLEKRLALGEQLVEIFTRKVNEVAPALRARGYRVTEFQGRGRDGEVSALFIEVPRRQAMKLVADAREVDDDCFYLVHDIRLARRATRSPVSKPVKLAA